MKNFYHCLRINKENLKKKKKNNKDKKLIKLLKKKFLLYIMIILFFSKGLEEVCSEILKSNDF